MPWIRLSGINNKIKLINISNSGASKARNIGINNANGIYIQFLDADDILSSNKIEHQVKILESNDVDVCFCRTVVNQYFTCNSIG